MSCFVLVYEMKASSCHYWCAVVEIRNRARTKKEISFCLNVVLGSVHHNAISKQLKNKVINFGILV